MPASFRTITHCAMQYSKRWAMPIARGKSDERQYADVMLHATGILPCRLAVRALARRLFRHAHRPSAISLRQARWHDNTTEPSPRRARRRSSASCKAETQQGGASRGRKQLSRRQRLRPKTKTDAATCAARVLPESPFLWFKMRTLPWGLNGCGTRASVNSDFHRIKRLAALRLRAGEQAQG